MKKFFLMIVVMIFFSISVYADKSSDEQWKTITKNGEKIMIDKIKGFMWQAHKKKKKYTWQEAKKYCSNLVYGGYSDWRLPSLQDYKDIFTDSKKKEDNSHIKTVDFKIEWHSPWIWTSTKYDSTHAWLFNAFIDKDKYSDLKKQYLVYCVRK